jgi:hypothetical protein
VADLRERVENKRAQPETRKGEDPIAATRTRVSERGVLGHGRHSIGKRVWRIACVRAKRALCGRGVCFYYKGTRQFRGAHDVARRRLVGARR